MNEPAPKKRKPKKLPNFLRAGEVAALLAAAQADEDAAKTPAKRLAARRDRLAIDVAATMGPRVAELCKLRIEDVDLDAGQAQIVEGKGGKDRMVRIPGRLVEVLRGWIGDRKTGYLFPGPNGKRMSTRTFRINLKQIAAAAGIARRVHPHCLRHTAATRMLEAGGTLSEVQHQLGHSSITITAIYLHCDTSRLKGFMDKM